MDETAPPPTTATSTSAAAIADSASTKIAGGLTAPPTTQTAAGKSTTSVKLVIKSSNQQYDDQVMESDLLWTVKQLKAHISVVYPSKPDVADQKLIYSGQLLNDGACIKDVIRSYKDVYTHNHIIHLVCATKTNPNLRIPKTTPRMMSSTATSGSAAPVGDSTDSTASANAAPFPEPQLPQGYPFAVPPHNFNLQQADLYNRNNYPVMRQMQQQMLLQQQQLLQQNPFAYPNTWNAQQLAASQYYQWMNQMYNQYMQQYGQAANPQFAAAGNPHAFMSPFGLPSNPVIPTGPIAAARAAGPSSSGAADSQQPQNAGPPQGAAGQQDGEAAPAAEAPARRFPNIVQDEDDPRDWLELFFTMTRMAVFLTILYFNSSPLRCLAVCVIALGIYIYHTRLYVRRAERNNNNINRNNNAANAAEQIQQAVRQVQHAQARAEQQQEPEQQQPNDEAQAGEQQAVHLRRRRNDNVQEAPESATGNVSSQTDNNNNNASVISVVRTFVVTFFTSLLPETPVL